VAVLLDELDFPGLGQPDPRVGHIVVELKTANAVPLLRYSCSNRIIGLPTAQLNARRCHATSATEALPYSHLAGRCSFNSFGNVHSNPNCTAEKTVLWYLQDGTHCQEPCGWSGVQLHVELQLAVSGAAARPEDEPRPCIAVSKAVGLCNRA
jgi:hypothetical protein